MKTHLVIIAVVLVIVLATPIDSSASTGFGPLLTVRIDDDCRVWWNFRRASPDNLPHLLPSDSTATNLAEYVLDIPALHELFRALLEPRGRCAILILSHPNSHYVCTDNVLAILDRLEDEFIGLKARELNKPVDSLVGRERFSMRYAIGSWYERDGKVMDATHAARGFTDSVESVVSEENRFEFQLHAGYWADRQEDMIEIRAPRVYAPKVGIPRPVQDEGPIDDSR